MIQESKLKAKKIKAYNKLKSSMQNFIQKDREITKNFHKMDGKSLVAAKDRLRRLKKEVEDQYKVCVDLGLKKTLEEVRASL